MANPLKDLTFQALFDAAADAMLLVDDAGHVLKANIVALQLLGYSEEAILKLSVEALVSEQSLEEYYQYRDAFFKRPDKRLISTGRDFFALSQSGKELAVDIGLSFLKAQGYAYILITFYPAQKRREAEQALRASEERLRLAKQAANLGIFDLDPKKMMFNYDEKMLALWGGKPSKAISYEEFLAAINPDDRAVTQAEFDRCFDPACNGEYNMECRITNPDDGIERWVSVVGKMQYENGLPTRLIGVVRDTTEHKLFEKNLQQQRAEAETVFTQQVAARTASAIAHELNQPLAAISAYGEVALHALSETSAKSDKLKRAVEGCVAQAQRAGNSLHELLAFLQGGELLTEHFNLNDSVKEALNITKSDGYKDFHLLLHLDKKLPDVLANRIQVQKVLVNLLRNAVEAMRVAGLAKNEIAVLVRAHKNKSMAGENKSMACVTVKDSGPSLTPETAKRIFEPFFTTKPTGIGMGLAISRALIEANGGQLWFEPNTKAGATFHFTLPFAPLAPLAPIVF